MRINWLAPLHRCIFGERGRSTGPSKARRTRLSVEPLEGRLVPSTFGVQQLGDPVAVTTRSDDPLENTSASDITISNFEAAAGEQRLLVVGATVFAGFQQEQGDITAVYFGDQPLQAGPEAKFTTKYTKSTAELWYLPLGDSDTATTADITFEGTGQDFEFAGAQVFTGVDQSSPVKNLETFKATGATSSSLSIGSHVGDLLADIFFTTTPKRKSVVGANQTILVKEENIAATYDGRADDVAISLQPGGLHDPLSWTIESSQATITHHAAFALRQQNFAPEPVGTISDVNVLENAANQSIDLADFFYDYERDVELSGIDLVYAVTSDNDSLVTGSVNNTSDVLTLDLASVGVGTATITVTATDHVGKTAQQTFDVIVTGSNVSFSLSGDETVSEGDANANRTFTITRTGETNLSSSVDYTLSGSATNVSDYTGNTTGTVTFAAGDFQKTVTITVVGDELAEGDETVVMTLSSPSAAGNGTASLGTPVTATKTITNDDAAPIADAGGTYVINEGEGLTLDASASTDADSTNLTFRWDVDGDGDLDEGITGITPTLSATQLAQLGLNDDFAGQITVEVSDGVNIDTATTTLTVNNVAPSVRADAGSVEVSEGETATLTGTFNDPGPDTVSLSASLGTVVDNGDGTWTWNFNTSDGPDQSQTVTITATDSDGASSQATFDLVVNNVAPTLDFDHSTLVIDEGQTATLSGTVSDIDGVVSLTASRGTVVLSQDCTWTWTSDELNASGNVTYQPVTLTATDAEGTSSTDTIPLYVRNVPVLFYFDGSPLNIDEGQTATRNGTYTNPLDEPLFFNSTVGSFTDHGDGTFTWSWHPSDGPDDSQAVLFAFGDDDDGALGLFDLVVNNLAPTLAADNDTLMVTEGQTATMSGTFADPGADTVSLSASAGSVVDNGDGTWNWSFNTSDGPDQSQTVTITATDSDGAVSSTPFDLVVNNAAPTLAVNSASVSVTEGSTASNSGNFGDPGNDTLSLSASMGTVTDNGNGTWSWSFNTSDGPDQSQTVTITATDSDGASSTVTFDLVVNNVAPTLAIDNATVTVDEGSTASNGGTFGDPGNDTVTLSASAGTVVDNGDGTWNWSFNAVDGPADSRTVTITATDSDGAKTSVTFDLVVNNVAPRATLEAQIQEERRDGARVMFSLQDVVDPGVLDNHRFSFALSEADLATTFDAAGLPAEATFDFSTDSVSTVFARVLDSNGGYSTYRANVIVGSNDPDVLAGTAGDDVILGLGGSDTLTGGDGQDLLSGGKGDDQLDGGNGADRLDGGRGNDLLAGGYGADELQGGRGDDGFVFEPGDDQEDLLLDFNKEGSDRIDLSAFAIDFNSLGITQENQDAMIDLPGDQRVRLVDFTFSNLAEDDFLF
jgi:hypothetical protein